jgi:hypothetical protein
MWVRVNQRVRLNLRLRSRQQEFLQLDRLR